MKIGKSWYDICNIRITTNFVYKMKNREFKIYSLNHPETDEIRYIGVTSAYYLTSRYSQHKHNSLKRNSQTYIGKWFRKVFKDTGKLPIIKLIEKCTANNWEEREKYWIKYYPNLTNIREGGKGVVIDRSKNSIERSVEGHKKKIVQLDKNFNLIKEWNSIKEASENIGAKSHSSISGCIKNNYGFSFGYRWMLKEDWENKNFPEIKKSREREIFQYSLQGNFIKSFTSIKQALKEVKGTYNSNLSEAAKREGTSNNFIWSYLKKDKIKPKLLIHKLNNDYQIIKTYTSFSEIAKEYQLKTIKIQTKFQNSKQNKLYKQDKLLYIYGFYWQIS